MQQNRKNAKGDEYVCKAKALYGVMGLGDWEELNPSDLNWLIWFHIFFLGNF